MKTTVSIRYQGINVIKSHAISLNSAKKIINSSNCWHEIKMPKWMKKQARALGTSCLVKLRHAISDGIPWAIYISVFMRINVGNKAFAIGWIGHKFRVIIHENRWQTLRLHSQSCLFNSNRENAVTVDENTQFMAITLNSKTNLMKQTMQKL